MPFDSAHHPYPTHSSVIESEWWQILHEEICDGLGNKKIANSDEED
jgi:hypothetical protein